jgi:hypothetical protein
MANLRLAAAAVHGSPSRYRLNMHSLERFGDTTTMRCISGTHIVSGNLFRQPNAVELCAAETMLDAQPSQIRSKSDNTADKSKCR